MGTKKLKIGPLTIMSSASCSLIWSRAYFFGMTSSSIPVPRGDEPTGADIPGVDKTPPNDKQTAI